jgi:hypothetical protein
MRKLIFFAAIILLARFMCNIFVYGQSSRLTPIITDFQVNDNTGIAGPDQGRPAIATNNSGRTVLVWVDGRGEYEEIYAQLFSNNGTLIGNNIQLTNHNGSTLIMDPSVSMDSVGNFIVTWYESVSAQGDNIYAQRFTDDGTPLGAKFKVNEGPYICDYPDITSDPNGNFVITWETARDNAWSVYAQMYASGCIPIGTNFRINDDTTDSGQNYPSISSDSHGNFIIVCIGVLNNIVGIYAQRFSSDGTPIGTNFKVNNDSVGAPHFYPDISFGGNDNFVVIWKVTGSKNLYGQRFSNDGIPLGNTFKINKDSLYLSGNSRPAVSADGFGNFIVTWDHITPGTTDYDIYAQRYASDGTPIGNNFKVTDDTGNRPQSRPAISAAGNGDFTIAWEDGRILDSDIYAQQYSSNGLPLSSNFKVNDDTLSNADQGYPSMIVDNNGDFVIAWHDYRNGRSDIYAQRISNDGTPIDTNFRVSADTLQEDQNFPDIASDNNSNFVITWIDGYDKIYAQRFSYDGTPLGNNLEVSESNGQIGYKPSALSIAMDSIGDFAICWSQRKNFQNWDIYVQQYSQNGLPFRGNFIVNDDTMDANQFSPDITMDLNGNFVVVWMSWFNEASLIYAQRFANDGTPIGNNYKITEDSTDIDYLLPSIKMNNKGNYIISWCSIDVEKQSYNIYAQQYSADGIKLGDIFRISESDIRVDGEMRRPTISFDKNRNFIVTWENRLNNKIYAQRYASDGTPIGNNFDISSEDSSLQHSPYVVLWNNKIYNTWEDDRAIITGYDVWANVLDFNNPLGIGNDGPEPTTNNFVLKQNYPNPFNPSTTINYELSERSRVEIFIYNISGQKIRTLINAEQQAGSYKVQWDGKNNQGISVASGMYLYQLKKEGSSITRKMILIR